MLSISGYISASVLSKDRIPGISFFIKSFAQIYCINDYCIVIFKFYVPEMLRHKSKDDIFDGCKSMDAEPRIF